MFDKETLETLIDKIADIAAIVEKNGFENLCLLKPKIETYNEKLHFRVTIAREEVSLFDKSRLKIALAEVLDLKTEDIIILTENELANPDDYIEKILVISKEHQDEIIASLYFPISSQTQSGMTI